jgi:hypothetical protein
MKTPNWIKWTGGIVGGLVLLKIAPVICFVGLAGGAIWGGSKLFKKYVK